MPAYTIGSKHRHLEIPTHPVGPNQYNLPNTIGSRNISTKVKTAPAFTMSCKLEFYRITIIILRISIYFHLKSSHKIYEYHIWYG